MYDVYEVRKDFPVLGETINGKPNTFLDTAASAQKPRQVIERMVEVSYHDYANVHRGSYYLSEKMTSDYENARKTIAGFINAKSEKEIVFTRNATESINLVAATWGKKFLKPGDEVVISEAEHHANLVPWQVLKDELGFVLKIFKVGDDGAYLEEEYLKALSDKTKLVSVTGMSNILGTVFPAKKMAAQAHAAGALFMLDACQMIVHQKVDVQDIDCDFMAFSGHKTYGPSGIGVLYGKYAIVFSPRIFGAEFNDAVVDKYVSPVIRRSLRLPAVYTECVPWQEEALQTAEELRVLGLGGDGSELEVKSRLFHLWALLCGHGERTQQEDGRLAELRGVMELIDREYGSHLTLADLAAAAHMSESHFCRSFAAVAHKTPFSYLQQVRIQKSCQYLKNSDLAVSRIAVSCGFNDLSYYARRFREQVGCTPTEYRRRAQSELPGGNVDQGAD